MFPLLALYALSLASPVQAAAVNPDPTEVSEVDAIECRLGVPAYTGFAMALDGEEQIARARKWKKLKSPNAFMSEYELPAPITVAGAYTTRRIAFTANAILAILDLDDPGVIARPAQIDNAMDPEPMIAALVASGKVTRAEAEARIGFRKFLGERILKDVTEPAGEGESFGSHMVVARTISNATSHPGKTLYGCAYRMELLDKDGAPL